MNFFKKVLTYIGATIRLVLLHFISFLNGIHNIFFNDIEIVNIQLIMRPNKEVSDNVSYIQKLRANNMDLIADDLPTADEEDLPLDAFNEDEFKEDSEYEFDEEDLEDDTEEDGPDDSSDTDKKD